MSSSESKAPPQSNEPSEAASGASCASMAVMFDGSCPLCIKEIGIYQSLTPLTPVEWKDVSGKSENSENLSKEERERFMARFHVRKADGTLLSGAAAFVAMWLNMPGWRWLGRLGSLPGATPVLEVFYKVFLRLRPRIIRFLKWIKLL